MLPLEFSTYTHAYQGYLPLKASKTWEAKTDLLQHTCTLVHTSHFHTTLLMLWTPEAQQILPQWLTNQWTVQQQLAPLLSISNSGLIFKLKKKIHTGQSTIPQWSTNPMIRSATPGFCHWHYCGKIMTTSHFLGAFLSAAGLCQEVLNHSQLKIKPFDKTNTASCKCVN